MTQIIPFESAAGLPAHITALFGLTDDLSNGVGSGFPHISIKGKVFHISRGGDKTLVTKPDAPDEPAASIEVVIVKANAQLSKVYYAGGYTEGSEEKPLCYSNDGTKPAADASEPQAKNCATCPHNQWGSRVTDNGGQAKACADSRRVAIAMPGQVNDPMLIRVPAASLKTLAEYNNTLKKRGVPYQAVVTKIGFDYSVAHPALTFKPVGFVDEATLAEVASTANTDVVANIIGTVSRSGDAPQSEFAQESAPKTAAPAKAAAPKAKPKAEVEDTVAEPVVAAPKVAPAAKASVIAVDSMDDMLSALDDMISD